MLFIVDELKTTYFYTLVPIILFILFFNTTRYSDTSE